VGTAADACPERYARRISLTPLVWPSLGRETLPELGDLASEPAVELVDDAQPLGTLPVAAQQPKPG
jgi:hypothetical protein